MQEIVKALQILFILSPVIIPIILLGIVLHRGFKQAQKYSLFWLIGTVVIGYIVFIRSIRNDSAIGAITSVHVLNLCVATYFVLKKRESKKNKAKKVGK